LHWERGAGTGSPSFAQSLQRDRGFALRMDSMASSRVRPGDAAGRSCHVALNVPSSAGLDDNGVFTRIILTRLVGEWNAKCLANVVRELAAGPVGDQSRLTDVL